MTGTIIGLVPARGGSKAIPAKNIAPCHGKPLIYYTAVAARECPLLRRTLLSTDDPQIAETGRSLGLEVPFLRPPELAGDRSPMIAVLSHALDWVESAEGEIEALVLLQPTSPLRRACHIAEAVKLFRDTGASSVVSVTRVPHACTPGSLLQMNPDGTLLSLVPGSPSPTDRHEKPVLYARNGPAILVVRPALLRRGLLYDETTVGYPMDAIDSVDVDEPADLRLAEIILTHRGEEKP